MDTQLIKIGNSRGVRIPKSFIEQLGLVKQVDMTIQEDTIVIRAKEHNPRADWVKEFEKSGADRLEWPDHIDPDPEELDWQW